MRRRFASLILLSALAATACAGSPEPAPIQRGFAGAADCRGGVTVRRGDTLSEIARRCDVDVNALARANNLSSPGRINEGQRLTMPRNPVYTVRRGDNLYRIALNHGMSTDQLAALNGLRAPYTIHPGQELRVTGEPRRLARNDGPDRTQPREPVTPPVTRNDGIDRTQPSTPPAARRNAQVELAAPGEWIWPLDGAVIGRFAQTGPDRLNGIRIAADIGQPVFAAASGTVTYSGPLPNYGELILIDHGGSITSVYAMNQRRHVAEGDRVRVGQHIADAGRSGPVERPLLHFEVRRGPNAVDPETLLPRRGGVDS